jgi:hypothetical protein
MEATVCFASRRYLPFKKTPQSSVLCWIVFSEKPWQLGDIRRNPPCLIARGKRRRGSSSKRQFGHPPPSSSGRASRKPFLLEQIAGRDVYCTGGRTVAGHFCLVMYGVGTSSVKASRLPMNRALIVDHLAKAEGHVIDGERQIAANAKFSLDWNSSAMETRKPHRPHGDC